MGAVPAEESRRGSCRLVRGRRCSGGPGRRCPASRAIPAADPGAARRAGVGAPGEREDSLAPVLDRRVGPGRVRRLGLGAGEERDPQRLWISVLDALRDTATGAALVRGLTAAPDLDGWTVVERLMEDLASLEDRIWLVIDDLHELCSAEALRQLELLIMRAPAALRFVLVTRHDLRLGLHRLRLAGELTEIRADDLRFSRAEARALLDAAGVALSDSALGPAVRPDRGLGGGVAAGRAVAGRASRSGALRGRVRRQRAHGRRVPAGRGPGTAAGRGPAAAAADLHPATGQWRAGRPADRRLRRGARPAAARGGRRVRHLAGRAAVLVSLPPALRRPPAAGAERDRASQAPRIARSRRRMVRRTRVPRRGGPAGPGRAELGAGRPPTVGPLGRPGPGWAGRHRARAPRPLPGRRDRRRCRAGGAGGRSPAGSGVAGRGRTVPGSRHPETGFSARRPGRTSAGRTRRRADAPGPPARRPRGRGRGGATAAGPRGVGGPGTV